MWFNCSSPSPSLCSVFPRCLSSNEDDRRILSFHLDKDTHTLYVAFSSCVVRIPLSRCERHSSCQKWVLNAALFRLCLCRQQNHFLPYLIHISFYKPEQHKTSSTIVRCFNFPYCVRINIHFCVAGLVLLLETRTVGGCHMELVSVFLQLCSKSYNH